MSGLPQLRERDKQTLKSRKFNGTISRRRWDTYGSERDGLTACCNPIVPCYAVRNG